MKKGFISYSHEDRDVCDALRKHLKPLEKAYGFDFWVDDRNKTGRHFDQAIESAIAEASAHLILVSSNSLWSKIIMEMEVPAIEKKHRDYDDLVMLVVVDRCMWQGIAGTLLASPRDKNLDLKPVRDWRNRNHALDNIRIELESAIKSHFDLSPQPFASWGRR